MEAWAIIPGYNEEKRIADVVERTRHFCKDIVVVDDGSSDRTADVVSGCHVLKHAVNLGKGAAMKTGADFAVSKGASALVFIDSDGQHDPEMIPEFLKALEGKDIVFGYRKLSRRMPFVFRFGNWFINYMCGFLFGIRLRDTQSGYRAMTASAYSKVRWKATGYFVETEMVASVGRRKLKYWEIPIATIYADKYKGTTVLDGMKIVLSMIWWRLTR